jgi:O-antigen ligase
MSSQTRLQWIVGTSEEGILLVIWLVQVMGLFFPWEIFVNPGGDALGESMGKGGFGVSQAVNYASYGVIVLLCMLRWKQVLRALGQALPFLILCGWIIFSTLSLHDPSKSGVSRFLILVIFSAYIAAKYDSLEFVGFLTRGFVIAVIASLVVMVAIPRLGLSNIGGDYINAWRGAFTHKNWLGAAMSLGVFVSGYSFIMRVNQRWVSGLCFLGCLFLLGMSSSATAWLSTAASLGVLVIGGAIQSERVPVLRFFAFFALAVFAIVLMIFPLVDLDLRHLPRIAGRSADLTGRTELWHAVWAAVRERPWFGHGYGIWDQPSVTRSNIWLASNWQAPHAHNNWLDAALQLGLIGVVISVFIWLSAIRRALWLVLVRYRHGSLFYLAVIFDCLTRSAVETVTFAPVLVSLFWWVITYIYIGRAICEWRSEKRRVNRPDLGVEGEIAECSA